MAFILYSLFIVAMLPIVLAWVNGYFRFRDFEVFDNNHPRIQQAQLQGIGARSLAAQNNAWEALAIYTVICFLAFASGVPLETFDTIAMIYLAMRILHGIFYITNLATLRSIVFVISTGCCVYIFYISATFEKIIN